MSTAKAEESVTADIEVDIDQSMLDKALHDILETLDEQSRALFSLRYEEELSVSQIAAIIGIPEGTVKSRLHKLINKIKQQLKKYEGKRV